MTKQSLMLTEEHAVAIDLGGGGKPSPWIEFMAAAASPTQIKSSAAAAALTASLGGGDYEIWMELHPSALRNFDELMDASKVKQIVMFLDYDGTLSPIVNDPDRAFMSDEMREAVRDVARHFPTAIVSGRCREKLSNFVRLSELYYAGNHGMDIKGPIHGHKHTKAKAKAFLFQPASEFLPMIDEKWNLLSDKVRSVLKEYPKLRLTHGRKVLRDRGQGFGTLISKIAKETNAAFSLREPSEVNTNFHL